MLSKNAKFLKSALSHFAKQEGPKVLDQLGRTVRLAARMAHVAQVLNTAKGKDPDTGHEVRIAPEPIPRGSYDDRLSAVIDASKERGWAIDVIEGGLFLGAYRAHMLPAAGAAFHFWINGPKEEVESPTCNLLQCMTVPLALPLFSRHLGEEQVMDLLFGRCAVMMGLHLPSFISFAEKRGLKARWATRKEVGRIHGKFPSFPVGNKTLVFEANGVPFILSGGIFVRTFFHGETPLDLVTGLLAQSENALREI